MKISVEALKMGVMVLQTSEEYARTPGYYAVSSPDPGRRRWEYQQEGDFWRDLIRDGLSGGSPKICCGDRVSLRLFMISHWLPRAPGLFWKEESRKIRGASENELFERVNLLDGPAIFRPSGYWTESSNRLSRIEGSELEGFKGGGPPPAIFNPLGKSLQVLGGVGNLRLLPGSHDALLCASSSGTYWRGIPVLVRGDAFDSLSRIPAHRYVDIKGVWAPMPREYAELLGGENGIPKGCILVEERNGIERQETKLISDRFWGDSAAWTLFEYHDESELIKYAYSYVIFQAGYGGAINYLDQMTDNSTESTQAASWLQSYVNLYNGSILTEYDQYLPGLGVMLPLNEMRSGVSIRILRRFIEHVVGRALSPETVKYDAVGPFLMKYFDRQELNDLVENSLGTKIENLVGSGANQPQVVDSIIQYCEEKKLMAKLILACTEVREYKIEELAQRGETPGFI